MKRVLEVCWRSVESTLPNHFVSLACNVGHVSDWWIMQHITRLTSYWGRASYNIRLHSDAIDVFNSKDTNENGEKL